MMELVYRAWDNISWEVMDKSWACFFNNLRSIMQCRGDNNYKQAHNQGGKRQKDTGTPWYQKSVSKYVEQRKYIYIIMFYYYV